jgi:hypothetical protein
MDLFVGLLTSEIYRASRYKSPVTLMRVALGRPSTYAVRFVDRFLSERTRLIDFGLAVGQSEFVLCLPHTDIGGASAVERRMNQALEEFEPITTVAKFPDDGESIFELLAALGASQEVRSALINLEDFTKPPLL